MGSKKYLVIIAAIILALALCTVSTLAYMFRETDETEAPLESAKVSCSVSERFENNKKSEISVKNTGNINAYIRVKLVPYWVDSEGNRVYRSASVPSFTFDSNAWLADSANNTYYYRLPLAPNSSTPSLPTSDIVLAAEDGCYLVLDVVAEAIQAEPAASVTEAWSVNISPDGKISNTK